MLGVLITRPTHQTEGLVAQLKALGANPILLPTIAITDVAQPALIRQHLMQLATYKIAIFTSPNAVMKTHFYLEQFALTWPIVVKVAAIGASTAQTLTTYALPLDFYPAEQFNSEALLALPQLQEAYIKQQKIVIFTGEGGRPLLAQTLQQRGAEVTKVEVYRRTLPQTSFNFFPRKDKVDIIVCTSNTGLQNLMELANAEERIWLKHKPLLVISQRTVALADQLGFIQPPLIATNATDNAIIKALITWQEKKQNGTTS